MGKISSITPDKLAAVGHALYGERWQSALARALDVSDRTVRRWAVGEFPIPDHVADALWRVLDERFSDLCAMSYEVVADERYIFHRRTGVRFGFDDSGTLTELPGASVQPDKMPALRLGAVEALRRARERDPSLKHVWIDAKTGQSPQHGKLYGFMRGSVIVPPDVDLTARVIDEPFDAETGEIA